MECSGNHRKIWLFGLGHLRWIMVTQVSIFLANHLKITCHTSLLLKSTKCFWSWLTRIVSIFIWKYNSIISVTHVLTCINFLQIFLVFRCLEGSICHHISHMYWMALKHLFRSFYISFIEHCERCVKMYHISCTTMFFTWLRISGNADMP